MKNLFTKITCPECGKEYDPAEAECPHCHAPNPSSERGSGWEQVTVTGLAGEIALFLVGSIGLTIVAYLLSYILQSIAKGAFAAEGLSGEGLHSALLAYVTTASYSAYLNLGAYLILFIVLLIVLGRNIYKIMAKFRQKRTYLGFLIGIGMMMITSFLSLLLSSKSNANQTTVESVEAYAPGVSLLIIGLIGPFCEELTYRVGLYTFLKRINWVFALIVTSLVFTFIHFDFKAVSSINEWRNVPVYFTMALILTFTYEKMGFGASFLAHATNNFVGILITIIVNNIQ